MFKKYFRILRIEFVRVKEYFLNFVGQIIYYPIQFLLIYFLWKYVFSNNAIVGGYTFYEMISYYFILSIVKSSIMPVGVISFQAWKDINEGKLNIYLSKPLSYPLYMFFSKIGYFIWNILFGLILICIIILLFFSHIRIVLTLSKLLIFVFSTFIGFVIMFNLFFITGAFTFWIENILTLRDNLWNIIKILSGEILPITMFPSILKNFCNVLPFQYIYFIPISIFQGKLVGNMLLHTLCIQILWAIFMTFISIVIWKKGVKNYSSQGG